MSGKPEAGYKFGTKNAYRRQLWNFVDESLRFKNAKRDRRVLILDTSDALETKFLVDRGYAPKNIVAVNRNAAELAWLTRRLKADGIEGVHTISDDVFNVLNDRKSSSFDAINLDLTGPLNSQLIFTLQNEIWTDEELVVSSSVLRGRESESVWREIYKKPDFWNQEKVTAELDPSLVEILKLSRVSDFDSSDEISHPDFIRLVLIGVTIYAEQIGIREWNSCWGRYRSAAGSQTMLWAARHLQNRALFHGREEQMSKFELKHRFNSIRHKLHRHMDLTDSWMPELEWMRK